MITPSVSPSEAAAAGCSASYSVDRTTSTETYYRLSATAGAGWEFDHFEWTQHVYDSYGTDRNYDRTSYSNPATDRTLCEYAVIEEDWDAFAEITRCVAVFSKASDESTITVLQVAEPEGSGTTAGGSTKYGTVGSTATFELAVIPKRGWTFVEWVDEQGELVSKERNATVQHTFAAQAQTFSYIAKMVGSGEIIHGAGGTILHGSGGTILFKG